MRHASRRRGGNVLSQQSSVWLLSYQKLFTHMKKTGTAFLFLILAFASAGSAHAQTQFAIGPRLGFELDSYDAFFVGADVRISTPNLPVVFNPTFDYYLIDKDDYLPRLSGVDFSLTFLQLGLNAIYEFVLEDQPFTPYAGAGVAITRVSVSADVAGIGSESEGDNEGGLNLFGGIVFESESFRPFIQAQATGGSDANFLSVIGGVLFSF